MKKLLVAIVATISVIAYAAKENSDAEKEQKRALAREKMLEKTGGIVEKAGTGKIAIINCQKKFGINNVEQKTEEFNKAFRVAMETLEGSWKFGDGLPSGVTAGVFIVDEESLPMTLVAVESHWGVLNVAHLDTLARFNKALTRVAIMTFGGCLSQFKGSPMQTVSSPDDLDKLMNDAITFDAIQGIMRHLQNIGVTQAKKTTYRKACMEGWANQPTNDFQKVIWEEVHAKPTKPIRIKYDPVKGE